MTNTKIEIAKQAFATIQSRFPQLEVIEVHDPFVDLSITFPVQSGLKYNVNLNLQGDELHFLVSHFWLEWFPCTKSESVEDYVAAVCGFLSGKFRILELYVDKKCVQAKLQTPERDRWKTIGIWSTGSVFIMPWVKKNIVVVQNV